MRKFSIVTLSFNQARFLEQAILSVITQDYSNIEYILVDPGSTDGSRKIIESYRDKIAKIIYDPDIGPADGLNKGFSHATGDIYGYLNADDYYEKGAFTVVEDIFNHVPEIDVVTGAIRIVDGVGNARKRKRIPDEFNLENIAEGICWIGQQATFFKNTSFGNPVCFNVANNTCWDAEFLVDLGLNNMNFGRIMKVLGCFRIHDDSITGSNDNISAYHDDLMRIRSKIYTKVPKSRSGLTNATLRALYKLNVKRHIMNYCIK